MSVKIKVSYETDEELKWVLMRLGSAVKSWAKAAKKSNKFFRAYIMLDDVEK